ncbi:hypothetical protein L7F22_031520, partial [Adiantum nelumboides]|nr:hypothetical protein [Adiantum nelumboides]
CGAPRVASHGSSFRLPPASVVASCSTSPLPRRNPVAPAKTAHRLVGALPSCPPRWVLLRQQLLGVGTAVAQ